MRDSRLISSDMYRYINSTDIMLSGCCGEEVNDNSFDYFEYQIGIEVNAIARKAQRNFRRVATAKKHNKYEEISSWYYEDDTIQKKMKKEEVKKLKKQMAKQFRKACRSGERHKNPYLHIEKEAEKRRNVRINAEKMREYILSAEEEDNEIAEDIMYGETVVGAIDDHLERLDEFYKMVSRWLNDDAYWSGNSRNMYYTYNANGISLMIGQFDDQYNDLDIVTEVIKPRNRYNYL